MPLRKSSNEIDRSRLLRRTPEVGRAVAKEKSLDDLRRHGNWQTASHIKQHLTVFECDTGIVAID